jgi:hypothetical protein
MHSFIDDITDLCDGGGIKSVTPPGICNLPTESTNTYFMTLSGVIVGSLGVIMLVSLLSSVAILVLVVAYQSRKHKRDMRGREERIDRAQNINTMDVETRPNDSYIPVFRQTSTEGNVAYGCGENRASSDGYSTINDIASMEGNAQESVTEQNEENHYEYID